MSDVAAPLFRRAIPGLIDRRAEPGGIRALLAESDYTIDSLSADVVRFDSIDAEMLLSHILFDYSRFALASLESYLVSCMKYYAPKAIAWPLVKSYYSAFYAGHAILRAIGIGVVRIDDTLPSVITRVGRLYVNPNFTFLKGTYRYDVGGIGQAQMSLTFRRLDDGAAIHVAFWDFFRRFIDEFGASVVLNGEPAAAQVLARIDEFTRLLRTSGPGSAGRLSEFRNAVNYRHEYAAWFPFAAQGRRKDPGRAARLPRNANVRLDLDAKDEPILAFRRAADFMASINNDLAELIIERSTSRQQEFGRHWTRLKAEAM